MSSDCSRADVLNAYRVFLGREAEEYYGSVWPDPVSLVAHFINSQEFDENVAQPIVEGVFPKPGFFEVGPSIELIDWITDRLPLTAVTARKLNVAKSWAEALQLLFADRKFSHLSLDPPRTWTIRLLARKLAAQYAHDVRRLRFGGTLRQVWLQDESSSQRAIDKDERATVDEIRTSKERLNPSKPSIVLVLHEATRTGAPILGWNLIRRLSERYNVVVVVLDGGELEHALVDVAAVVIGPTRKICENPKTARNFAERLKARFRPLYVIGNTVDSAPIAIALRQTGLALVLLVHEFSSHAHPRGRALQSLYMSADRVVFPAQVVAQSSIEDYDFLRLHHVHVIPQGPSTLPSSANAGAENKTRRQERGSGVKQFFANVVRRFGGGKREPPNSTPARAKGVGASAAGGSANRSPQFDFRVIGLGTVDLRKGVDLFIATATALRRLAPELNVQFRWYGHFGDPSAPYQSLLREQIDRSGLGDLFEVHDAVDDLEPIYRSADALFVSSRLDPLPNVAIDAALRGKPVVCFDKATGMAEILKGNQVTAPLVVPHLDTGAAAELIVRLVNDQGFVRAVGGEISELAHATFDMDQYAVKIDDLGRSASLHANSVIGAFQRLADPEIFDPALFAGGRKQSEAKESIIDLYLNECRRVAFSKPPVLDFHPRRPLPGFHPMAYALDYAGFPKDGSANPLIHWLDEGRPEGSWSHRVIVLGDERPRKSKLSAALHGHFHYTDHFSDFLDALRSNSSEVDLFLTVTSAREAKNLHRDAIRYRSGRVSIEVVPNRGRDIRPFLHLLARNAFHDYDVVGHIHGKKSLQSAKGDADLGDRWRKFLWESLLGPSTPAVDIIFKALEDNPGLGLVFPQNPEMIGWERNFTEAGLLAKRMGITDALPTHLDFPVGTMFWARPAALQPFVDAQIQDEEYPKEPIGVDGTMLHAIERLLTLAAHHAGFQHASAFNKRFVRI